MKILFAPSVWVVLALATADVAAFVAVASSEPVSGVVIWEHPALRSFCMIGATLGSMLAVLMLPDSFHRSDVDNMPKWKRLALHGVCSLIGGLVVAPISLRWSGWSINVDNMLIHGATVGFLFVPAVNGAIPIVRSGYKRWVRKVVDRYTRTPDSEIHPPRKESGATPRE